jgi:hypothetical protein
MGERKFQKAVIEIGNSPDVAHAFRKMLEVRGDPEKKDLFQRRQSTLTRTIAKKASRPGCAEVTVEAVLDYLQHPLAETEPGIMEFSKDDFDIYSLPQKQGGRSKRLREMDLAPAVGSKRPLVYKVDRGTRGLRNSNCIIVAEKRDSILDNPKVESFYFGIWVGRSVDGTYKVIVVDGPAQALALADYYDREGMPNPVKRERLRRQIKRTKFAVAEEQTRLAAYEKELAALGDGR